jgi:hypothetical protein
MATLEEAIATLNTLADELQGRRKDIEKFDGYYRGVQGKLEYASPEFSDFFSSRYESFSDNWCGVVADAPTERLETTGVRLVDKEDGSLGEVDKESWRIWRENDADYFSDQAYLDAIIANRAYMMVWGNPDDEDTPRITFEHPSQAIVGYDPETRAPKAGLKMWIDEDSGKEFATLYLPTEVWKFQRNQVLQGRTSSGLFVPSSAAIGGWEPREVPNEPWPLPNPLETIPLAELPNRPRLIGEPMSDIAGVTAMQDAINLLWAYLLNAADFASFPQRVVMNADRPKIPILDEAGQVVGSKDVELEKFAVNRVVWLEDPNAKIGEWSAANLALYTGVLETCVSHTSAQSRTPPHYLMSKIVNANAETLKTAETGLVKRAEEKTESFGRGERIGFSLVALAQGDKEKAKALRAGKVLWKDVEIRSEAQAVDAAQKLHAMGYPLRYISRRLGMAPDEIEEVMEMRREEAEMDPTAEIARSLAVGQPDADES